MANPAFGKCYLQLFYSLVGDFGEEEVQRIQLGQSFQVHQSVIGDFSVHEP